MRVNIAAREQQSKFRKKRAGGSEERSKRTSTPTASNKKPAEGIAVDPNVARRRNLATDEMFDRGA